ncbi:DNA/RNA helicase, superfamily I [Bernardetia litoralis DSM 6794]|uniref:DNA helicase n=1 Tax=Bernardetia litoralis (strain ATCC 23117 / DSM 6794 / NBRC 15988 / NCIMB 1366 / Fx l1 / Sio-4) TaxID=880071 RepID=I4AGK6_BERLS|nr:AAA domain-containing protein [Bernardetia litoralis]AFM03091.1 DNA/RNA helicase, superfamily I [Bernardetia litoralis DSM 6794]
MKNSEQQLTHLQELLKIEKREDAAQYQVKIIQAPLAKRRKDGLCWFPVAINDEFVGLGGRWNIDIERTNDKGQPHQLNVGSIVTVFEQKHGLEVDKTNGVVSKVENDKMRIALNNDELPDFLESQSNSIGVYSAFDDSTYREMNHTIEQVKKANNDRLADFREIFLGEKEPVFDKIKEVKTDKNEYSDFENALNHLNESQKNAVQNILRAQDIAIIHGPPGTGKTTTLVAAIVETLKNERQIMVCAPSNTAVDWLTEKLNAQNVKVTRLGHPARVSDTLEHLTLDGKIEKHPDYKYYKSLLKQSEQMRRKALKFKRNFGKQERSERQHMLRDAKRLKQDALKLEEYISKHVLEHSQVLACTLAGSANYMLNHRTFSTLFIDEAAQALEGATWIPILKANRVIMAGDHQQLPPTIKSFEAAKSGLENTLFEKIIKNHPQTANMLSVQYRMNEQIMEFSNQKFYNGNLKAFETNKNHVLYQNLAPVEFVDTAGCGFSEMQNEETLSRYNPEEAKLVVSHLQVLFEEILLKIDNKEIENSKEFIDNFSVGVLSTYKAQVYLLRDLIRKNEVLSNYSNQITIHTVDGFQGQEREVMYISLVRSNEKGEIGFLKDFRRFNVAITRAKKRLVVFGDSATLGSDEFYKDFLDYTESIDAYKSAWEYMV